MTLGVNQMAALEERAITGFNAGYRMNCNCGRTSFVSCSDYHMQGPRGDARMPCEHCGRLIHFGPAVAALRDSQDVALTDDRLSALAWYHTSTSPDWPSPSYSRTQEDLRRRFAELHPGAAAKFREPTRLRHALHVGTYESAVENMLRRMYDQDDARSAFYLHRVALQVDSHEVNAGYRDENHEPAARLTLDDLARDGLRAVRYLNVHEDVGSLSLAIHPSTIVAVQTLPVPPIALTPIHDATLTTLIDDTASKIGRVAARMPDTSSVPASELRMARFRRKNLDPNSIAAVVVRLEDERGSLWSELQHALHHHFLTDTSPVLANDVDNAMGARQSYLTADEVREFARFYSAASTLLTSPHKVVSLIAAQKPRVRPSLQ